jgi:glycosyltransferase 2 family protein
MRQLLACVQPLFQQVRLIAARPAIRRWLGLVFGLMGILAAAYALVTGVGRVDWATLNINWRYIVLAWLATIATTGIGVLGWAQLAKAMFPSLSAAALAHIHIRSLLAKYLPGGVWNTASKLVFLRQLGVGAKSAGLAVILELSVLLLMGLEDALIIGSLFPSVVPAQIISPALLPPLLPVITIVCVTFPLLFHRFMVMNQIMPKDLVPEIRTFAIKLWLAELVYLVGWLCLCGCFSLTVASVIPLAQIHLPTVAFATVLSFIIGLVVIVIPNGIGLRELSYSVFMSKMIPTAMAVSLGFTFRLISALAEISLVMVVSSLIALHNAWIAKKRRVLTPLDY